MRPFAFSPVLVVAASRTVSGFAVLVTTAKKILQPTIPKDCPTKKAPGDWPGQNGLG